MRAGRRCAAISLSMKLKRSLLLWPVSAMAVFGCEQVLLLGQTQYAKDAEPTGLE
jgi:hypothetical protein